MCMYMSVSVCVYVYVSECVCVWGEGRKGEWEAACILFSSACNTTRPRHHMSTRNPGKTKDINNNNNNNSDSKRSKPGHQEERLHGATYRERLDLLGMLPLHLLHVLLVHPSQSGQLLVMELGQVWTHIHTIMSLVYHTCHAHIHVLSISHMSHTHSCP